MNYNNVNIYRNKDTKKGAGLYKKTRAIALVVLGVLVFVIIFSMVFKTKVFKLDKKEYYGVNVGCYASEATAIYFASSVKNRGGCGGIVKEDNQFHVFAAVYNSKADASSVAAKIAETDEDASVYTFTLPKIKIKISEGNRAIITNALSLFEEQLTALLDLAVEFDNNNINGNDIVIEVIQMIAEIDAAVSLFNKIMGEEEDSAIKDILAAFSSQKLSLKQLSHNVIKSFEIKTVYFDILLINLNLREKFS